MSRIADPRFVLALALALLASLQLGAAAAARGLLRRGPGASGLRRARLRAAPAGDPRLFVVERAGRIRIVDPVGGAHPGAALPRHPQRASRTGRRGRPPRARLRSRLLGERASSTSTTSSSPSNDSLVSRFTLASPAASVANPATEEVVLRVPQTTAANHNGGTLAFSPIDGMLYLGLGDGGGSNDQFNNAQNPATLLGKMLRIDVSAGVARLLDPRRTTPSSGNDGIRDEIWAFGLRNPFRFAFDRATGDLWIADVGPGPARGGGPRGGGRRRPQLRLAGAGGLPLLPAEPPRRPVREPRRPGALHVPGRRVRPRPRLLDHRRLSLPRAPRPPGTAATSSPTTAASASGPLGMNGVRTERTQALGRLGAVFAGITGISEDGFGELFVANLESGVVHHLRLSRDSDQDRLPDAGDNCPFTANRDQADGDGDGTGDACDSS